MGQVFYASSSNFFEEMTVPEMRFSGAVTREALPGWNLGSIVMGELTDENAPVASMLKMAPGDTLPKHAHNCYRVEIVVQGSLDIGGGRVLRPGDITTSGPGEFYGPHVAGPEGSLSVEIFSAMKGLSPIQADLSEMDPASAEVSRRVQEALARYKKNA